jgi:[histone H3]-lysine4 N-trimethyltransferase ASH1L
MIIDATKGSIARFVNHSCKPNCRMVKWIVAGKPRMALFAGDRPIMTGEELTYDYNFDPFSAKNVQECRCGSDNCRGILGPRPKDQKAVKESVKDTVKSKVKGGKRKLKELLAGDKDESGNARGSKKRKIKEAKGVKRAKSVKRSATSSSRNAVKVAAKVVKKRVSTQLSNARKIIRTKRVVKKTAKAKLLEAYGKRQMRLSSSDSNLTLVKRNSTPKTASVGKNRMAKNVVQSIRRGRVKAAPRGTTGGTIRVVAGGED